MLTRRTSFKGLFVSSSLVRAIAAAFVLGAALMPFASAGCSGKIACIQKSFSITECPSRQDALTFFQQGCASSITSVDSDPTDEGADCCYDVTESDFGAPCAATVGSGGVGPGSTGTGTGSPCQGAIGGACGDCGAKNCCNEINNCIGIPGCAGCLNDEKQCLTGDFTAAQFADELDTCLRKACPVECFGAEAKQPDCSAKYPSPPSLGSCAAVDEITFFCNPVTNNKCFSNDICDFDGAAFNCAQRPLAHTLCEGCGATGWCDIGLSCVDGRCAAYCCDDVDCSPASHCDFEALGVSGLPIGVCLSGLGGGTGGAGGAGGAGGSGGN